MVKMTTAKAIIEFKFIFFLFIFFTRASVSYY